MSYKLSRMSLIMTQNGVGLERLTYATKGKRKDSEDLWEPYVLHRGITCDLGAGPLVQV